MKDQPGKIELLKSHIDTYTRKDGTIVQAHDDKRVAKPDGHPMIAGRAEKLQGGDAKTAHGFRFAGKEFSASGKTGTSFHDGRPVRHFREGTSDGGDSGDHVWLDHHGNVHADSYSDVRRLKDMARAGYNKPAHVKTKADEFDHLSKIPAEKRSPEMKARLKKLSVDAGMGKHSSEYKAHLADGENSSENKPAIRSNNEGQGFHGEAMDAHIREQHGPDTYHGSLSEKDHTAAVEAGHKKFAEAADHLVSAGHFENHDQAREYLDSKHGRHLHDGASFHGGDISKVAWLKKDVADFKKAKAGGST